MAEDKEIKVKEQDDGSLITNLIVENDDFGDSSAEKADDQLKTEILDENTDDGVENLAEGGEVDDEGSEEDDEEREKIREARREERRLKKELQKQREASSKHKISALERRNEELAQRLLQLEGAAVSFKMAQLNKTIEDEATRVEYTKMKMLQAAQSGDAAAQIEFLDQLTEAKQKLQQLNHFKKQQLEQAKKPAQNVPTPMSSDVQQLATGWLRKNSWYDPEARDTDSRIAKVIDQELATDGWDPADPEYWEELDNRLSARLPHRYAAKGGSPTQKRSSGPTASSRVSNAAAPKANTITLSRDRVQAIKDAGAWDDVEKRNKMIRAYAQYDRANKG